MRDIWTEGSGARKRGWYDNPVYTGREVYHPSRYNRKQEQQATIEYIEPPERYAINHPVKTAINKHANAAIDTAVRTAHSIPTKILSDLNQGLLKATDWINVGIGAVTALISVIALCYAFFAPMDISIKPNVILSSGFLMAISCTILILLYRYHQVLQRRFHRAGSLNKRSNIVTSLKKTLFMLGRTLLFMYGIFVPGIAKICLLIFT